MSKSQESRERAILFAPIVYLRVDESDAPRLSLGGLDPSWWVSWDLFQCFFLSFLFCSSHTPTTPCLCVLAEWMVFFFLLRYIDMESEVQMVKRVGAGAFGEVWEGSYQLMRVAVKQLHSLTDEQLQNFEAELTLMSKLHHENIVRLFGAGEPPPPCFSQIVCLFGGLSPVSNPG